VILIRAPQISASSRCFERRIARHYEIKTRSELLPGWRLDYRCGTSYSIWHMLKTMQLTILTKLQPCNNLPVS
jgi:hypothetical protein